VPLKLSSRYGRLVLSTAALQYMAPSWALWSGPCTHEQHMQQQHSMLCTAIYVHKATLTINVRLLRSHLPIQLLYITGILYIVVSTLHAVMSTALHASAWQCGELCGFVCVQARKPQVARMGVQHSVCALPVAAVLMLLLSCTLLLYCVVPHRLGACVHCSMSCL
jgi:hypothetical protein